MVRWTITSWLVTRGQVHMPGDDGYLLGAHVNKDFVGRGGMAGRVVAYDKSEKWYL